MSRNDPRPLTAAQLEELERLLEALREEIQASLADSEEDARPVDLELSIGRLTRGDAMQQQQMARARRERLKVRAQQARNALFRLEEGTYGICLSCDEPIGYARLKVAPEAPFCRACQRRPGVDVR